MLSYTWGTMSRRFSHTAPRDKRDKAWLKYHTLYCLTFCVLFKIGTLLCFLPEAASTVMRLLHCSPWRTQQLVLELCSLDDGLFFVWVTCLSYSSVDPYLWVSCHVTSAMTVRFGGGHIYDEIKICVIRSSQSFFLFLLRVHSEQQRDWKQWQTRKEFFAGWCWRVCETSKHSDDLSSAFSQRSAVRQENHRLFHSTVWSENEQNKTLLFIYFYPPPPP